MKFIWKLIKWIFYIFASLLVLSVLTVVLYKYINPHVTPLMLQRVVESWFDGKSVGITKEWKNYEEISPNFFRAVIISEDGKFYKHNGFDWDAIERAKKFNERMKGKRVHGASTISQQTAKNVFLFPLRSMIRKAFEAYFTVLIEAIWGKKRILEVYANVIEMGEGIYGVEAASQRYFNKPAKSINTGDAALLASILPNPRRFSAINPSGYIERRSGLIQSRMGGKK
jgi:monofunctional glycosyltransferase